MKFKTAVVSLLAAGFIGSAALNADMETDRRISRTAKESYVFRNYLNKDSIEVKSKDGLVTLTGKVSEKSHKVLAEETVASLPGVKKVDNRLETVKDEAQAGSDSWTGAKIKTMLLFHRNVSATKTSVTVKDGVATLRGEAESIAQRDLTEKYVSDVEGVASVRNEMTVVQNPKSGSQTVAEAIDDASITAQVKLALLSHRSTSALATKVSTENGAVSVGGQARNGAEKDLVTALVSDIKGVKSVDNRMTVQETVK